MIRIETPRTTIRLFDNLNAAKSYAQLFNADLSRTSFLCHTSTNGVIVKINEDLYDTDGNFSRNLKPECFEYIQQNFYENAFDI